MSIADTAVAVFGAVERESPEEVKRLLQKAKAHLGLKAVRTILLCKDNDRNTLLSKAIRLQNEEVVNILLEAGAEESVSGSSTRHQERYQGISRRAAAGW